MTPTLYLVRHTRPAIAKGLCYGQMDIPLAESFEQEASLIREALAPYAFTKVFTSPLKRCALLAKALNLQAQPDPRLMEMHFGDWEGKAWDTIFTTPEGKIWFDNYITAPCPHGESFTDLMNRVQSFLAELLPTPDRVFTEHFSRDNFPPDSSDTSDNFSTVKKSAPPPHPIPSDANSHCLITHAGVIRAILVILCGVTAEKVFDIAIPHGEIVEVANGRFSLKEVQP